MLTPHVQGLLQWLDWGMQTHQSQMLQKTHICSLSEVPWPIHPQMFPIQQRKSWKKSTWPSRTSCLCTFLMKRAHIQIDLTRSSLCDSYLARLEVRRWSPIAFLWMIPTTSTCTRSSTLMIMIGWSTCHTYCKIYKHWYTNWYTNWLMVTNLALKTVTLFCGFNSTCLSERIPTTNKA